MSTTYAAPRGRTQSRAATQYLALLRARRALREARELSRKPTVRAAAAVAIDSLDVAIDRIERRAGGSLARPSSRLEQDMAEIAMGATGTRAALQRDLVELRRR